MTQPFMWRILDHSIRFFLNNKFIAFIIYAVAHTVLYMTDVNLIVSVVYLCCVRVCLGDRGMALPVFGSVHEHIAFL